MKKVLSVALALCLLLGVSAFAASGEASNGPMPNMAGGSGSAAYKITDDGLEIDEALLEIEKAAGAVISAEEISGARFYSEDNEAGVVSFSGTGTLKLGGEADNFAVDYALGEGSGEFNTVIDLREADDYVWGSDNSGGAAIAVRGNGDVYMENVYALNTGISRFTVSLSKGTNIIKDCYFESLGCLAEWCDMPWFTAQLGNSRNLIACGTLSAYIYNSVAASEGYGSWSTDTGGNPFVFYLYNGDSYNYYGGYGTYADTGLVVNIYGSRLDSAEYGVFATNTGVLNIGSSADALNASDEIFLENLKGEELAEDTPSEIVGARNAVVYHVVDTMSRASADSGVKDSSVSKAWKTVPEMNVTNSVITTIGACGTPVQKYPVAQQAWMDHMTGSAILFRGACGVANLTNVTLEASNGILIHSVLDLDESSIQILDDVATEDIPGGQVNSVDNDWTGDIVNEDYQRPLYLDFANTTLTGAIRTYDIDHWNALFADYADVHYVVDETTGRYVNADDPTDTASSYKAVDPSVIYGWICAFDEYDAVRGTYLTMDAASVWNVTERSNLNGLTVAAGAVVNGTVTVDGEAVDISAGGSWTGDIVVTPAADAASGEASNDAPPIPAGLAPGEEPPGGFGGID